MILERVSVPTLLAIIINIIIPLADGHGLLDWPNPRGALRYPESTVVVDERAPLDYFVHFPAGDKSEIPGAGLISQIAAANEDWTPFEPMKTGFNWRAGLCGDLVDGNDHLKGGIYYWPENSPKIVHTYKSGDIIDASLRISAHHNGFVEMHLCDVSKCPGGDISPECFNEENCLQLARAPNPDCDDGMNKQCGPIDRNYPGRWYMPCSTNNDDAVWESFGPGTIKYQIPETFSCAHCVLHWFYTSANLCNPPGVVEYFDGPDAPKNWGKCEGQAGAVGGVTRIQPDCGGRNFPEEYYSCTDVAVHDEQAGAASMVSDGDQEDPQASPAADMD